MYPKWMQKMLYCNPCRGCRIRLDAQNVQAVGTRYPEEFEAWKAEPVFFITLERCLIDSVPLFGQRREVGGGDILVGRRPPEESRALGFGNGAREAQPGPKNSHTHSPDFTLLI